MNELLKCRCEQLKVTATIHQSRDQFTKHHVISEHRLLIGLAMHLVRDNLHFVMICLWFIRDFSILSFDSRGFCWALRQAVVCRNSIFFFGGYTKKARAHFRRHFTMWGGRPGRRMILYRSIGMGQTLPAGSQSSLILTDFMGLFGVASILRSDIRPCLDHSCATARGPGAFRMETTSTICSSSTSRRHTGPARNLRSACWLAWPGSYPSVLKRGKGKSSSNGVFS